LNDTGHVTLAYSSIGLTKDVYSSASVFSSRYVKLLLIDDDDDEDDEGRINFSVALTPKTTRTRNNKLKQ